MLSLFFLVGAVASLSMIIPGENDVIDNEPDTSTDGSGNGKPDGADDTGTETDDTGGDDIDDTADTQTDDDQADNTPPSNNTPREYTPREAKAIMLTDANGEETSYALSENLIKQTGHSDQGSRQYDIKLPNNTTLSYEIKWTQFNDADGPKTVYEQEFNVELHPRDNVDWDYRKDGFSINLLNADGDVIGDKTYDIDALITGKGQNNIVTEGNVQVKSAADNVRDWFTFHVDALEDEESFTKAGYYDEDGGVVADPDAIMPSNELLEDGGRDTLIVEVDKDIPGHVHLMKVTTEETYKDTSLGFEIQLGTYNTVHYLVETASETPPTLDQLNVLAKGAVKPADGLDVLAAFTVDSGLNNGLWLESDAKYVDPKYTGKSFASITQHERSIPIY